MVMSTTKQIHDLVHELNRAWIEGRFEDLRSFFHEDVVFVTPGFSEKVRGREACVESYRGFTTQAKIHGFELQEIETDTVAGIAIASCPYAIDYELEGRRWRGNGRDLLILVQDSGTWSVVWRTMMPGPEEEVARDAES